MSSYTTITHSVYRIEDQDTGLQLFGSRNLASLLAAWPRIAGSYRVECLIKNANAYALIVDTQ